MDRVAFGLALMMAAVALSSRLSIDRVEAPPVWPPVDPSEPEPEFAEIVQPIAPVRGCF